MNLISQKITNWQQRKAITLVEVLTSITVAVIGVAGVLILIPFATQQANVGLTLAESTTIAENSISRFRIEGFNRVITIDGQNVLPWIVPRQPNVQRTFANLNVRGEELADFSLVTTTDPPRNFPRSIYFIDPLWLNVHLNAQELDFNSDGTVDDIEQETVFDAMFQYLGPDVEDTVQQFHLPTNVPFHIDTFQNGNNVDGDPTTFPNIPPFLPTYVHLIDTSNPFSPNPAVTGEVLPNQMTQPIATRMFVSADELQFAVNTAQDGTRIDPIAPPQPYYDQVVNGVDDDGDGVIDELDESATRRQYLGDISWSAIAVARRGVGADLFGNPPAGVSPTGLAFDGFDFHILVYKDRSFSSPLSYDLASPIYNSRLPEDEDPRFLYAPLVVPVPPVLGADNTVEPVTVKANGDAIILNALDIDIQNDEWLMLVNYDLQGIAQVGFFRTIGSLPARNGEPPSVLVDGPEFVLYDEANIDTDGDDVPDDVFVPNRTATYAIYLKDVINVYKRQVNPAATE